MQDLITKLTKNLKFDMNIIIVIIFKHIKLNISKVKCAPITHMNWELLIKLVLY